MATNYWISTGSTDGNLASNWSLGTFAATDTLTFDNTKSTVECDASAGWTAQNLIMTAGYTGTVNLGTYSHSLTGNLTIVSTCTFTQGTSLIAFTGSTAQNITSAGKSFYDIIINRTGSGDFTFTDTTSCHNITVASTNTQRYLAVSQTVNCSGNYVINGHSSNYPGKVVMTGVNGLFTATDGTYFSPDSFTFSNTGQTFTCLLLLSSSSCTKVTVSDNCSVTYNATNYFYVYGNGPVLVIGNNASFTTGTNYQIFQCNTSADLLTVGSGSTFVMNGYLQFRTGGANTVTIPALTMSGTGAYLVLITSTVGNSTVKLTGNLNIGTIPFFLYGQATTNLFDFNNYNVTCGKFEYEFDVTGKVYFRNGNISCTSFAIFGGTAAETIDMGSAQITCSGSWVFESHLVIIPGTSKVTFTNTATITSNGKSFYNLVIQSGAATVTLADNVICELLTVATGTLNRNGKSVTASEDYASSLNCLSIGAL